MTKNEDPKRPADNSTRCPQCGETATRSRVVPAFSCRSCGCVFRPKIAEARR